MKHFVWMTLVFVAGVIAIAIGVQPRPQARVLEGKPAAARATAARAPSPEPAEPRASVSALHQTVLARIGASKAPALRASAQPLEELGATPPSAEDEAHALAAMQKGIDAQPRDVQLRYYTTLRSAAPAQLAAYASEIARLGAEPGQEARVAELQALSSALQARVRDYDAALVRLSD